MNPSSSRQLPPPIHTTTAATTASTSSATTTTATPFDDRDAAQALLQIKRSPSSAHPPLHPVLSYPNQHPHPAPLPSAAPPPPPFHHYVYPSPPPRKRKRTSPSTADEPQGAPAAAGVASTSSNTNANTSTSSNDANNTPASTNDTDPVRCICGIDADDGFTIQCERCHVWQHAACFAIKDQAAAPDVYLCERCLPRPVDYERARRVQAARFAVVGAPGEEGGGRRRRAPRKRTTRRTPPQPPPHPPPLQTQAHVATPSPPPPPSDQYVPLTHNLVHPSVQPLLRSFAHSWRGITALSPADPIAPYTASTPVGVPRGAAAGTGAEADGPAERTATFLHPLPPAHPSRPPSYTLRALRPIARSAYVVPYTCAVTPAAAYLREPTSQYAQLGVPKQGVHLLPPPLALCLDARTAGGDARWLRSGCHPNAVLRPVVCAGAEKDRPPSPDKEDDDKDSDAEDAEDDPGVSFAVFALRDVKAHEEIVLGWEWDDRHVVHELPRILRNGGGAGGGGGVARRAMAQVLASLCSTFTTCACGGDVRGCAVRAMERVVEGVGVGARVGAGLGHKMSHERKHDGEEGEVDVDADVDVDGDVDVDMVLDLGPLVGARRGLRTEVVGGAAGREGVRIVGEREGGVDVDKVARAFRNRAGRGKRKREARGGTQGEEEEEERDEATLPPKMRKQWIKETLRVLNDGADDAALDSSEGAMATDAARDSTTEGALDSSTEAVLMSPSTAMAGLSLVGSPPPLQPHAHVIAVPARVTDLSRDSATDMSRASPMDVSRDSPTEMSRRASTAASTTIEIPGLIAEDRAPLAAPAGQLSLSPSPGPIPSPAPGLSPTLPRALSLPSPRTLGPPLPTAASGSERNHASSPRAGRQPLPSPKPKKPRRRKRTPSPPSAPAPAPTSVSPAPPNAPPSAAEPPPSADPTTPSVDPATPSLPSSPEQSSHNNTFARRQGPSPEKLSPAQMSPSVSPRMSLSPITPASASASPVTLRESPSAVSGDGASAPPPTTEPEHVAADATPTPTPTPAPPPQPRLRRRTLADWKSRKEKERERLRLEQAQAKEGGEGGEKANGVEVKDAHAGGVPDVVMQPPSTQPPQPTPQKDVSEDVVMQPPVPDMAVQPAPPGPANLPVQPDPAANGTKDVAPVKMAVDADAPRSGADNDGDQDVQMVAPCGPAVHAQNGDARRAEVSQSRQHVLPTVRRPAGPAAREDGELVSSSTGPAPRFAPTQPRLFRRASPHQAQPQPQPQPHPPLLRAHAPSPPPLPSSSRAQPPPPFLRPRAPSSPPPASRSRAPASPPPLLRPRAPPSPPPASRTREPSSPPPLLRARGPPSPPASHPHLAYLGPRHPARHHASSPPPPPPPQLQQPPPRPMRPLPVGPRALRNGFHGTAAPGPGPGPSNNAPAHRGRGRGGFHGEGGHGEWTWGRRPYGGRGGRSGGADGYDGRR